MVLDLGWEDANPVILFLQELSSHQAAVEESWFITIGQNHYAQPFHGIIFVSGVVLYMLSPVAEPAVPLMSLLKI